MKEAGISRRELLRDAATFVGAVCLCRTAKAGTVTKGLACGLPELEAASLKVEAKRLVIDLAKTPSLATAGSAAQVSLAGRSLKLVVVRPEADQYHALSAECTHAGRPLGYVHKRKVLQYANFGHSVFCLAGRVIKGPAPSPLKQYPVTCREGRLEVDLA